MSVPQTKLELRHHLPAKHRERLLLLPRQPPWDPVDEAQRSEGKILPVDEGHAGIKPDVRLSRHQGIGGKPIVSERVGYFKNVPLKDRMGTKRDIAGRLADAHSRFGFEPLPQGINEADECDRHLAGLSGQLHQIVKRRFRFGIEDLILS